MAILMNASERERPRCCFGIRNHDPRAVQQAAKGFGSDFNAKGDEAEAEIIQGMVATIVEVAAEKPGAALRSGDSSTLEI